MCEKMLFVFAPGKSRARLVMEPKPLEDLSVAIKIVAGFRVNPRRL